MSIRFTKKSTDNSIALSTQTTLRNWDPKSSANKPIFNFNAYSNGNVSLGSVQEKLLKALAGGHTCGSCDDTDDLFTLTEKDLKEAHKHYLDKDINLFGDIKIKNIRYDEYHGAMTIITQKGDVLNVDLLTEAEKRDGVDSSKTGNNKPISTTNQTQNNNQQNKPSEKKAIADNTKTNKTPIKTNTKKTSNNNTPTQIAQQQKSGKRDTTAFLLALANRESGGKHTIMNKYGYVGAYQVGEEALHDVGVYYETEKMGINYKKNDWKGYVSDRNKYGITCLSDFMHSPAKQKAVQIDFKKKHWEYLENLKLTKYIGKTINGTHITESGLLAGAHLVGPGGVKRFLTSNGRDDVKDANGTPVSSYIKKFAGYDIKEITRA